MTEIRRPANDQQKSQDEISRDHDFLSKLITKTLVAIRAKEPEECKEKDHGTKHDPHHCVAEMDVNSNGAVQGQETVKDGTREG